GPDRYIAERSDRNALELLCFGDTVFVLKPQDKPVLALRYAYRAGLSSFVPSFNAGGQPTDVVVHSHNLKTGESIIGKASASTLRLQDLISPSVFGATSDKLRASGQSGDRIKRVVSELVQTQAEADALALALMKRQVDQLLTAQGTVVGD